MNDWLFMCLLNFSASLALVIELRRRPWLILKPSVVFIAYYQVSVMWPGLAWMEYIRELVPEPRSYIHVIHVSGLVMTLIALLTWGKTTYRIARDISQPNQTTTGKYRKAVITLLGLFTIIIAGWYLRTVGWSNTGLHAILGGSETSAQTREDSMKLLSSQALKYAWAVMAYSAAYILAYFLAVGAIANLRTRHLLSALLYAAAYLGVLILVMLPGARAPAAMIVLTTVAAFYARSGFKLSLLRIVFILAITLIVPATISLLRNNEPLNPSTASIYYLDILDRVAGRSVQDNIWMVSYASTEGHFGISGIPLIAKAAGVTPSDIFNIVGLYFKPDGLQSISANCSFIAVNYACFGFVWGALGLSALVTLSMDALLWIQLGLPRVLKVPCASICAVISMNFAMTSFTTVFVTHGLLPSILLCFLLHFFLTSFEQRSKTLPVLNILDSQT